MRLLYVVTEDWYFLSHRLPMARAARDAGFEVHVATRVVDGAAAIRAEGFVLHPVPFVRGRISPFGTIATIRALRDIHREHRARRSCIMSHCRPRCSARLPRRGWPVSMRQRADRARLYLHLGQRQGDAAAADPERAASPAAQPPEADRPGAKSRRPRRHALARHRAPNASRLIPGSGVDVEVLQPHARAARRRRPIAFVGRLLADKGIRTLIGAHRLLRQRGSNVELLIAGTPDPANPGIGERTGGCRLEPGARHHLARSCRGYLGALGARPYRGAAVAARGTAEKPAGGRGLRPADDRHRRARAAAKSCIPGETGLLVPVRRSAGAGTRDRDLGARRRACGPVMAQRRAGWPSSASRPRRSAGRRLISIAILWKEAARLECARRLRKLDR